MEQVKEKQAGRKNSKAEVARYKGQAVLCGLKCAMGWRWRDSVEPGLLGRRRSVARGEVPGSVLFGVLRCELGG